MLKTDPYAREFERRPGTAARVRAEDAYVWGDEAWMERRGNWDWQHAPMSIYEVHLGSWKRHPDGRFYSYRELAEHLVPYVRDMGFTHVELMPVSEHPLDESWGYQTTGYFAATARFGSPDDLRALIDAFHQAGIGVLVDWVPAHFPMDGWALARFDGTALYEHEDPRLGLPPGLGHAYLQLRAQRGGELPAVQRALLAGRVPRRRLARGCGRFHALPRLLAQGGRVAAQPLRRAREPGGDRLPARAQRHGARGVSRCADAGGGIHRMADGVPAHLSGRAGVLA